MECSARLAYRAKTVKATARIAHRRVHHSTALSHCAGLRHRL